ncbi:MAG TPA: hypothetical protein VJ305_06705 [Streptosporangiaceae bacterium]|nr:hypothetical protein [Streptosporangiaceae bacterium]
MSPPLQGPDGKFISSRQAAVEEEPPEAEVVHLDYIEEEPPPAAPALAAGEDVHLEEPLVLPADQWEEEAIGEHLEMVGGIIHELWGKAESDWVMSERDLKRMRGPLTRILNRYEPTARASMVSDPLLLGYGTTMYAYRSILQARAAEAERREAEQVPPDAAGYETVTPQGPTRENGRSRVRRDLRFPEVAREADDSVGE